MTRDALLRICLAQIAAGHTAWVTALRDAALAKIAAGVGEISIIVSGAMNGKTVTRTPVMNCLDVADCTLEALAEADEDNAGVGATTFDFSCLGDY